jgi:hypothetical protein
MKTIASQLRFDVMFELEFMTPGSCNFMAHPILFRIPTIINFLSYVKKFRS